MLVGVKVEYSKYLNTTTGDGSRFFLEKAPIWTHPSIVDFFVESYADRYSTTSSVTSGEQLPSSSSQKEDGVENYDSLSRNSSSSSLDDLSTVATNNKSSFSVFQGMSSLMK